jgi:hypothetical protein
MAAEGRKNCNGFCWLQMNANDANASRRMDIPVRDEVPKAFVVVRREER